MGIDEMKRMLEELNPVIYCHSIRTMEEAAKLSECYGEDTEKARIAGLLHDCGKKMVRGNDNLTHSKTGAHMARDIFHVSDEDILNAIAYHTTGRENMSMLEKVIFIADKIEQGRKYDGVSELRKAAYEDIDKAIIMSIESTVEYVKMKNAELDDDSIKTLKFLKEAK